MTFRAASKPSVHTLRAYHADLAMLQRLLAYELGSHVDELSTEDLTVVNLRAVFAAHAGKHAKNSIARFASTVSGLCDFLVKEGTLTGNPMAGVARPKVDRGAPKAFSSEAVDRLIEVLQSGQIPARRPWPQRDYAVIATLAVTGLRASEIRDLNIGDLEGADGERHLAVRLGKGSKTRFVPIDPRLETVVNAYLFGRRQRFPQLHTTTRRASPTDPLTWFARTAPLLVNDSGHRLTVSGLNHLVHRAYRAAGIDSERAVGSMTHALRHSFATRLVENGASAMELMDLLGHESLQTSQRYLSTRPENLRAATRSNPVYARLR